MEKNLATLIEALNQTKSKISEKKEQLRTVFFDGESGEGLVIATLTGNKKLVNIAIDDSLLNDNIVLEEHLITAINNALDKVSELKEKEISSIKKEGFPYVLNF